MKKWLINNQKWFWATAFVCLIVGYTYPAETEVQNLSAAIVLIIGGTGVGVTVGITTGIAVAGTGVAVASGIAVNKRGKAKLNDPFLKTSVVNDLYPFK